MDDGHRAGLPLRQGPDIAQDLLLVQVKAASATPALTLAE